MIKIAKAGEPDESRKEARGPAERGRPPAAGRGRSQAVRVPLPVALLLLAVVLYFGREVLIPIALALLLAFLLAPVVRQFERWRVPRVIAVVAAVSCATLAVAAVAWLVHRQVTLLAEDLPKYKDEIVTKMRTIAPLRKSAIGKAGDAITELSKEIVKPDAADQPALPQPEDKVVPVRVVSLPPSPLDYAGTMLSPLLVPLATAVIVLVFTVFMLMKREDLRDRLIRLIGAREMHVTTPALDEVAQRVSRYLVMQLICNAITGAAIGAGLYFLGVPNAALSGLMIALLRFAPYIGVWIGAAIPIALSLATSSGWGQPMAALGWVIVVEVLVGNFIEPMLVGARTGLSPLAVLISAVFWSWLWGPVGLLLATPLTVCLAVLGRHVPRLRVLDIVLGDEPALPDEARLYQRLLADDHEEAAKIVGRFAQEHPPAEVIDDLLLPTLRRAEEDRHRGDLEDERSVRVQEMLAILGEDLLQKRAPAGLAAGESGVVQLDARSGAADQASTANRGVILLVPARDSADELGARWAQHLLEKAGYPSDVLSSNKLVGEMMEEIEKRTPAAVCVSAVPPDAAVHARVLCRRVRARFPTLPILVSIWNKSEDVQAARERLGDADPQHVVTTAAEAIERLKAAATAAGARTTIAASEAAEAPSGSNGTVVVKTKSPAPAK